MLLRNGLMQRVFVTVTGRHVRRSGTGSLNQFIDIKRIGFKLHIDPQLSAPGEGPFQVGDLTGQIQIRGPTTDRRTAQLNPIGRETYIHITQRIGQREIGGNQTSTVCFDIAIYIPPIQQLTNRLVHAHIDILRDKIILRRLLSTVLLHE